MKIKLKPLFKTLALVLGAAGLTVGCATPTGPVLAQDRVYERLQIKGPDSFHSTYHFTESNGELGFRFYSQGTSQSPCVKGFFKLTKSFESDAVIYTTKKDMAGCENYRLVFPNNDLSNGYVQSPLKDGNFYPVAELLAFWKNKGRAPDLTVKR